MSKTQWEKFFEIMELIVTSMGWDEPMTWQEKKAKVLEEAEEFGGGGTLEEFVNWFAGE